MHTCNDRYADSSGQQLEQAVTMQTHKLYMYMHMLIHCARTMHRTSQLLLSIPTTSITIVDAQSNAHKCSTVYSSSTCTSCHYPTCTLWDSVEKGHCMMIGSLTSSVQCLNAQTALLQQPSNHKLHTCSEPRAAEQWRNLHWSPCIEIMNWIDSEWVWTMKEQVKGGNGEGEGERETEGGLLVSKR